MKASSQPLSSTSLPRAPMDEAAARFRRYATTMAVRIACFLLMAFVTPYGWYTWVFAAGAIVLPYVAVVLANVGLDAKEVTAEAPGRALPAAPEEAVAAQPIVTEPSVIRISESRRPPADRTP